MLFQTALALMELYGTSMCVCDFVSRDELDLMNVFGFLKHVIFLYVISCRSCVSND
jgi:hypothetical protein